jgi:uncharacterized protein Usg
MVVVPRKSIVTLNIIYYRPDYRHVLQEFVWSTEDQIPELHRVHKFLLHWKHNIHAVIKEILLGVNDTPFQTYKSVDDILRLH